MQTSQQTETLVFDCLPLAVIKIDVASRITYANPIARELFGDDMPGRNFREFIPDELWPPVQQQLSKRTHGEGGFYETQLQQPDGRCVPVEIAGIPLIDPQGRHIGSVGIIRSLLFDHVAEEIRVHIDNSRDGPGLLKKVALTVRQLVPFDYFLVARYSTDFVHSMTLHRYDTANESRQPAIRWWKLPGALRTRLDEPWIEGNFQRLMDDPEMTAEYQQHPSFKAFIDRGYQSFLRCPIIAGGALLGSVVLFSHRPNAYSQSDVDRLRKLPLEEAVQMALYYEKVEEKEFRHRLLHRLLGCREAVDVAQALVTMLAEHYHWTHACIVRVDEAAQEFALLAQHSSADLRIPSDYRQDLDEGVLSHVYRTGNLVNLSDNQRADHEGLSYKVLREEFCSELCLRTIHAGSTFCAN